MKFYRLLNEGEKILPTDEFYRESGTSPLRGIDWIPVGETNDEYKDWYLPIRREMGETGVESVKSKLLQMQAEMEGFVLNDRCPVSREALVHWYSGVFEMMEKVNK